MSVDIDRLIREAELQIRDFKQFADALRFVTTALRTDIQDIERMRLDLGPPPEAAYPGYGLAPLGAIRDAVQRLDAAISTLERNRQAWETHLQKLRRAKQDQQRR